MKSGTHEKRNAKLIMYLTVHIKWFSVVWNTRGTRTCELCVINKVYQARAFRVGKFLTINCGEATSIWESRVRMIKNSSVALLVIHWVRMADGTCLMLFKLRG